MDSDVKKRVVRAGGWRVAKRLIRPIPVIGTVLIVGVLGYEIKKKGLFRGSVNAALDATPVLGMAKGIVELFTGDLIPTPKRLRPASPSRDERYFPSKESALISESEKIGDLPDLS